MSSTTPSMPSIDYAFAIKQALLVEPHSPTWDKFLDKRRAERPLTRRQAQAFADLQQGFKPLAEQAASALYRLYEQREGEEVPAVIGEDPLAQKTLVNDALLRDVVAGVTGVHLDTSLTFFGQHVVEIPSAARGKLTPELWANRVDALHFGARWRGTNLLGQRTGTYFKGGYNTGHGRFFAGVGSKRILGCGWPQLHGPVLSARHRSTLSFVALYTRRQQLSLSAQSRRLLRLLLAHPLARRGRLSLGSSTAS